MKTQAIIPTAGLGVRLASTVPKPFVLLHNKPIFIHTLEVFEQCAEIDSIILVVHPGQRAKFQQEIESYALNKVKCIIDGGQTRCASVYNGLQSIDQDTDIVLIHDGARPLITFALIDKTIAACIKDDAVVLGVPVKSTIKKVNVQTLEIIETLNRQELWEIQTPQVFKKDILIRAHARMKDQESGGNIPTDDASLVEQLGVKVKVVQGDYRNIKITTLEDLSIAELFLT